MLDIRQTEGAILTIALLIITSLMGWVAVTVHTISGDVRVVVNELGHHDERIEQQEHRLAEVHGRVLRLESGK